MRREKVGFDFITFLSPEASRAVWDYLNYRDRNIETTKEREIRQRKKHLTYDNKGYLFITKRVHDDYLKTGDEELRKIDNPALFKIYRTISNKAGKSAIVGDWNKVRSHNIRKMFNSCLLNAGCDSFNVEFWMGHTLSDTQSAYFRSDPEKMKEIYQKYIPFLTIQKELDISKSSEYQSIMKENDVLRAETARHVVERSEVKKLKDEINRMKEVQELEITTRKTITDMLENPEIMASLHAKLTELQNKS